MKIGQETSRSWIFWLLCALGIVFPFSVAVSNLLLGLTLVVGIVSGIWWAGARHMWAEYRGLSIAMLTYWVLMLIGLVWSLDRMWGLHVLGHQTFWLVVPVLVAVLGEARRRVWFIASLSIGLALHLGFCVLQRFRFVDFPNYYTSNADNATGFIGHISFGFVYGIWAGWLLHWGWRQTGWKRWSAWLLAIWAWVMIFAAQGRGGYIVAFAIMVVVLWRHWIAAGWRRVALPLALVVVMIGVLAAGPGKERLALTWNNMTAILHGDVDIQSTGGRWLIWIAAVDVWKNHPVLGVGTGGYPNGAMAVMRAHPDLMWRDTSGKPLRVHHPHNMYLFSLARWGLFGLAVYLALVVTWIRTGWQLPWDRFESPMMALAGIALALDGLFEPTLEQFHSGVMLVMMLGLQLAVERYGQQRDP